MYKTIIVTFFLSLSSMGFVGAEGKAIDEKPGMLSKLIKQFLHFQDQEKDLEIHLPLAEGKKGWRGQLGKVIEVQADGTVSVDKKILTLDLLEKKLKQLARVNKDQAVRIRGNANTEFDKIVRVMDSCRKAGIWNISFSTVAPKHQK